MNAGYLCAAPLLLIIITALVSMIGQRRRAPQPVMPDLDATDIRPAQAAALYQGRARVQVAAPAIEYTPARARMALPPAHSREVDWLAHTWAPANDERMDAMNANLWDVAERVHVLINVMRAVVAVIVIVAVFALVIAYG